MEWKQNAENTLRGSFEAYIQAPVSRDRIRIGEAVKHFCINRLEADLLAPAIYIRKLATYIARESKYC